MKDFHLSSWLLKYCLSKISAKLAISLNYKIIFANLLIYCWTIAQHHLHISFDEASIIWKSFEFIFSDFLLKALSHQTILKMVLKNS